MKRVLQRVRSWMKWQIEANDPVQRYLAGAVDLVDLEHRMRALQRNEVRGAMLMGFRH